MLAAGANEYLFICKTNKWINENRKTVHTCETRINEERSGKSPSPPSPSLGFLEGPAGPQQRAGSVTQTQRNQSPTVLPVMVHGHCRAKDTCRHLWGLWVLGRPPKRGQCALEVREGMKCSLGLGTGRRAGSWGSCTWLWDGSENHWVEMEREYSRHMGRGWYLGRGGWHSEDVTGGEVEERPVPSSSKGRTWKQWGRSTGLCCWLPGWP